LFSQVSVGGGFLSDILARRSSGHRLGFGFTTATIAAVSGWRTAAGSGERPDQHLEPDRRGARAGGAVTIATSRTDDVLATGSTLSNALTEGFQRAFWAGQ